MWTNSQWKLTTYGIECIAPVLYEIPKSRLLETTERNGQTYYDWPIHMAGKEWVEPAAFNAAFRAAVAQFAPKGFDAAMLERSFEYAKSRLG